MANKALIRKLHFNDGRSIRQLAKDFGYARQIIRKALEDSEIPTYTRKAPYVSPVLNQGTEREEQVAFVQFRTRSLLGLTRGWSTFG